jgi:hypothetical protein
MIWSFNSLMMVHLGTWGMDLLYRPRVVGQ